MGRLCFILCLIIPLRAMGDDAPDEELLALARDGMSANLNLIQSFHAEVTEFESQLAVEEDGTSTTRQHKRYRDIVFDGGKCRQKVQVQVLDEKGSWRQQYEKAMSYDGIQTRTFVPSRKIGIIEAGDALQFPPARDMFCGYRIFHNTKLTDLLANADNVEIEKQDNGETLFHLTVPDEEGVFDVWLAAEKGFLISAMKATGADGRLAAERRKTKMTKVEGAWFITEMEEVIFSHDDASADQRHHIKAKVKAVNQSVPEATFRLVFPKPTLVTDRIQGTQYLISDPPLVKRDSLSSSWKLSTTALVALNVVIAIVVIATFFWRHRKQ